MRMRFWEYSFGADIKVCNETEEEAAPVDALDTGRGRRFKPRVEAQDFGTADVRDGSLRGFLMPVFDAVAGEL